MRTSLERKSGPQLEDSIREKVADRKHLLEQYELLAQRNSAGVRLIIESESGDRLLLVRKRGLGGEKATFTDLAGALIIDRTVLRNILRELHPGSVPTPGTGLDTGWLSDSQGVITFQLKHDDVEVVLQEWVNGYIIQNIVIDQMSRSEECDARVYGFQDYHSQALYEVMIETEVDWQSTLTTEIHQELGIELDVLKAKAGKMLSNSASSNWPDSYQREISHLRSVLQNLLEDASPAISFIPTCRISGKTQEKTHGVDIAVRVVITDDVIQLLREKGYVTDLSMEEIAGSVPILPVLTPMIIVRQGELNSCAQWLVSDEEDISTAVRFGDTSESAIVALSSQLFV